MEHLLPLLIRLRNQDDSIIEIIVGPAYSVFALCPGCTLLLHQYTSQKAAISANLKMQRQNTSDKHYQSWTFTLAFSIHSHYTMIYNSRYRTTTTSINRFQEYSLCNFLRYVYGSWVFLFPISALRHHNSNSLEINFKYISTSEPLHPTPNIPASENVFRR